MAVVANATAPVTLDPATALAVVANATAPDTLPPAIELNPLPLPVITPVVVIVPFPNTVLAVALPTVNPVNIPTLVIFV